jgi:hypothetical protein
MAADAAVVADGDTGALAPPARVLAVALGGGAVPPPVVPLDAPDDAPGPHPAAARTAIAAPHAASPIRRFMRAPFGRRECARVHD